MYVILTTLWKWSYACIMRGFFFIWRNSARWARASSFTRFLDSTQGRTAVCRTPPDEWSARRRDLCLTTHNIHNRQTPMPAVGFEPTISAGERPQTYALDRAATGTGIVKGLQFFKTSPVGFKVQILKPTTQTTPGVNVGEVWILTKSSDRSSGPPNLNFIVIHKILGDETCRQKKGRDLSGFGGLEVACWPLVPKFAGSNPAEAVGFFRGKNPQHAFLRRGSKTVGPMS